MRREFLPIVGVGGAKIDILPGRTSVREFLEKMETLGSKTDLSFPVIESLSSSSSTPSLAFNQNECIAESINEQTNE